MIEPSRFLKPLDRITWRRRLGGALLLALLLAVSVEAAFRIFMAMQVGPQALLYGTRLFRQEISVAKLKDAEWNGGRTPEAKDPAQSPSATSAVRAGYSKYFPNEVKVDFDEAGEQFSYRLNRDGFRGPDFEVVKPAGVVRIVTLGASSTYGFGSRDNETYPSQLQDRLNAGCASPLRYEVINLGIPHLTSRMILDLFIAEGVRLNPDLVTFYEGYNDTSAAPGAVSVESIRNAARTGWLMAEAYTHLIPVYRWIRDWSMSLLLVDNVIQSSQRSTAEQVAAYRSEGRATEFLANVRAIRSAAEKAGAKFTVVSQQAKSFLVPREAMRGVSYAEEKRRVEAKLSTEGTVNLQELYFLTHSDLMDALRKWTRAEEVPFVDGIERLDGRRDLLHTWVHLNPEANALLADAIADNILLLTCK